MISTGYLYRHDLLLSPDEHYALSRSLSHTLIEFHQTSKLRVLADYESKEFQTTKVLYECITGMPADRLLETYEEVLNNPSKEGQRPF